ncbi:hypothetical protein M378DRAFT_162363, partial [Amanita muscaria Koide BX008]
MFWADDSWHGTCHFGTGESIALDPRDIAINTILTTSSNSLSNYSLQRPLVVVNPPVYRDEVRFVFPAINHGSAPVFLGILVLRV